MIGDCADAQRVETLLGSHLGNLGLRDFVRFTTDRDGTRLEMYQRGHEASQDVLDAVADFIQTNGAIHTSTSEFATGLVAGTPVTVNVSPRLALLTPIRGNIA